MPYIAPEGRAAIDPFLTPLLEEVYSAAPGDLNYIITRILHAWIGEERSYSTFNAAMGVIESAKLELYRRMVAPYEDEKIAVNGDVMQKKVE